MRDHAYPIPGEKDVKDVDVKDVHAVLSPKWLEKHPTAKKIRWGDERGLKLLVKMAAKLIEKNPAIR